MTPLEAIGIEQGYPSSLSCSLLPSVSSVDRDLRLPIHSMGVVSPIGAACRFPQSIGVSGFGGPSRSPGQSFEIRDRSGGGPSMNGVVWSNMADVALQPVRWLWEG